VEIREQAIATALDHREHEVEAVGAEPGVGNVVAGDRVELAQPADPVMTLRRTQCAQVALVRAVHRDDAVEALEVVAADLARALAADVDAVLRGDGDGARVGRLADVPIAGARGVDLEAAGEAAALDQRTEDALAER
jgi:hypothetical protein